MVALDDLCHGRVVNCGDALDDATGDGLGVETDAVEDDLPLGVVEELLRNAVQRERRRDALVGQPLEQRRAHAADAAVVLDADDQPVVACELHEGVGRPA